MVIKDKQIFFKAELESERRINVARTIKTGGRIHLIGICGSGMAQVAVLMKELGFEIQGSDKAFYPPMGEIARKTASKLYQGYHADNVSYAPDLVIIGNSVSKNNPEVEAVLSQGLPYCSMPEILSAFLIGDREHCSTSIVVTGTHGKTTTTAAIASFFDQAGWNPGYFIGGAPINLSSGIRKVDLNLIPEKRVVVLEGDEYDSAFFAKWAKFHSYRPDLLVITSLEFDHADIYDSVEEIELEFDRLVKKIPQGGIVLFWEGQKRLRELSQKWRHSSEFKATILSYGTTVNSNFRLIDRQILTTKQQLTFSLNGKEIELTTPLTGLHNALNLLAAAAICFLKGLTLEEIKIAASVFEGVERRQRVLIDRGGVCLIEDFAHHPTAVATTLEGIKERYGNRRIVAVFEPRSNTSKQAYFQLEYGDCFNAADLVIIKEVLQPVGYVREGKEKTVLNVPSVIKTLRAKGKEAYSFQETEQILMFLTENARKDDVIVIMSNGNFDGLPVNLCQTIQ